jgi:hypothetical protein
MKSQKSQKCKNFFTIALSRHKTKKVDYIKVFSVMQKSFINLVFHTNNSMLLHNWKNLLDVLKRDSQYGFCLNVINNGVPK